MSLRWDLRSEEDNITYIGGEKRVVLIDHDIPFDLFESKIRRASGSGSSVNLTALYSVMSL